VNIRDIWYSWYSLPALNWSFVGSVFAACTFNFDPRAVTCAYFDFGNLAWGWCAITSLGWFDADQGGHLILWDVKLIICFPPGSTILMPSAIIRHSNIPVQPHEKHFSFVQYTAGGLFQWIRNGYMTDEDFLKNSMMVEKVSREKAAETRWEEGVQMFSSIDNIDNSIFISLINLNECRLEQAWLSNRSYCEHTSNVSADGLSATSKYSCKGKLLTSTFC
jgi:hypothetical protein